MSFPHYEKYKDSGVEWLGEVPQEWEVKPVKTVCTYNDEVLDDSTPADYDIDYVEISGVSADRGIMEVTTVPFCAAPSRARRRVKDGDVIVSTVRTYLRAIAPVVKPADNMIVSTGFAVVRPRSVHPAFLGHLLRSEFMISSVISRSVGVSYPAINASDLVLLKVPLPPLPEQQTIAAFLDRETGKIDALVAEQERLIELLKEKRQAVISHAVTKGLNPDAPMKDSGIEWLGEVPEGWEVKRLKALANSIKAGPFGSALTKDMYVSEGYRVYGQEQVIPGDFTVGDYFINHEKFTDLQQYQVAPGDILISCVGTFGKIAIVPNDIEPGIINPRLLRVRCAESVFAEYFTTLLRSDVVFEQFSFLSRGGTMDIINIGILSEIFLVLPPLEEQTAITTFLDCETARIDTLTGEAYKAIGLLKERRSALISAAVTGKIDVRGNA
ncbi:MAG: restriction endonuclease subunit S [Geobacteraceae bacterium]|nr:restriction endonuclease subunit S [Geobacteraceae bacterium]